MVRVWSVVAGLATVGLVGLSGCGGGGAVGSGSLGLYVMDSFSDEHAQVWASVYRVEVAQGAGPYRVVFDEAEGAEVNLPDLAAEAEFLGTAAVPAGLYTRARITLRNAMRLVRHDGAGSDAPLRLGSGSGFAAGGAGQCTAEFAINCPIAEGGQTDLAVDFDLPSFSMRGGNLEARIVQGADNRFRAMAKRGRLRGTIANLDPGIGFDLVLRSGRSVRVALTPATAVVSAGSGAEVAPANGMEVFVFGQWDPATRILTATVVVVVDAPSPGPRPAHVRGRVVTVDADRKSFTVEPVNAYMSFRPMAFTVTVNTTDATVYGFIPRAPATFGDVKVDAKVDVIGAKDPTSEAITARRVLIAR